MKGTSFVTSATSKLGTCVSCADEIDAIAPKRETAQREMERRIVAQMLTCMDDLSAPPPSAHQDPNADPDAHPQLSTPGPTQQSDGQQNTAPSSHVVIIGKSSHMPSRCWLTDMFHLTVLVLFVSITPVHAHRLKHCGSTSRM